MRTMSESAAEADDTARGAALRPVPVVLNGSAGALLDKPDAAETLVERFRAAGLEPRFVPTDAGTLPERLRAARDSGLGLVVVGGGDGTVACAGAVLAGGGVPLAVLPFGTMNLLAKDLGLEGGDAEGAIRAIAAGRTRDIDVGEVNGEVFLCASMLGMPTRLGRHREAGRKAGWLRGWARYAVAALRQFDRHARMRVVLRLGDRWVRLRAPSITISVNPLSDASGRAFGRARLDGGELAVYVVDSLRLGDVARLAARVLGGGRWKRDEAVREARVARGLTVAVPGVRGDGAVRVMNDGEMHLLRPPLRYRVRPGALRVVVPEPPDPAVAAGVPESEPPPAPPPDPVEALRPTAAAAAPP